MKPSPTRRYRHRVARPKSEGSSFKKESQETFFGSSHENFFPPALVTSSQSVQRKCEDCERGDAKLQRAEDKKEEEKKVMRMEDKKEEEKIQRAPDKKEEEKLQKKEGSVSSPASGNSASNYIGSINANGQPLPKQHQYFFGSRMGYDFSNVKVHTDKEAAESAKEINAKAFTVGNNIVFNEGQYNTESQDGKKLLAHELAHVVQNQLIPHRSFINRKAEFKTGKILKDIDLAANYHTAVKSGVNNSHAGITIPFLNGRDLRNAASANPLILPTEKDLSATQVEGRYKSSVTNVPLNTFTYEMHIPVQKEIWKAYVEASDIKSNLKKLCSGMINVYISGNPDSKTIVDSIYNHEKNHVAQWQELFKNIIIPFDKDMQIAGGNGATETASKKALIKHLEILAKRIFEQFTSQYDMVAAAFHGTTEGGLARFTAKDQDPNCNWVKIKVSV